MKSFKRAAALILVSIASLCLFTACTIGNKTAKSNGADVVKAMGIAGATENSNLNEYASATVQYKRGDMSESNYNSKIASLKVSGVTTHAVGYGEDTSSEDNAVSSAKSTALAAAGGSVSNVKYYGYYVEYKKGKWYVSIVLAK